MREFARDLRSKVKMEDVGKVLAGVGALFGLQELMITDVDAAREAAAGAVLFSARSLPDLRGFLAGRSLATHPVLARSWEGDEPFSLSEIRNELKLSDAELWGMMPPWACGNEAISINVRTPASRHLNLAFAGKGGDVGWAARSVLHVASTMAVEHLHERERGDEGPRLTKREAAVVQLIAAGRADDDVATELAIAPRTVRFHLENAKGKLGVATRAQIVLMVLRGELP